MLCSAEKSSNLYQDSIQYISNDCVPLHTQKRSRSSSSSTYADMSLTELVLELLKSLSYTSPSTKSYDHQSSTNRSSNTNTTPINPVDVGKVLSSIMMNGLPLLGLDDFVYFSDYVRLYLGQRAVEKIMSIPILKERFENFLAVRKKLLFITGMVLR